ncbi:hypothetical protein ACEWY4_017682 [Coilia grayii]|uniref:G-protein coupled receptors family 1 profile domain-containing protein n=1 Tax=Coilia grayii TaxID=363190 RepID=A0ABD1JHK6_9TELE
MSRDPPLSDQGETIIGVYLLVLGWLSWFGNSVVIFVLFRQRLSLQPTDYLTLNLAVSDASIAVFGYSRGILEIFNVFHDNGFLITSVWTCQVDGFCTLLFGLGSINTLTVISVVRYIKGCHPNKTHCITNTTIAMCILFIWLGACFWSAAPLLGWGSYTDRGYGTCEIDWAKANYSTIYKSYIISILIFCFFLPVTIMLFSYISIIKTVKRGNAMASEGDITDRQRKIERDVTIVSIVICTAFILAWSPYAVVSMWSAWGFHVPSLTSIFTRLFAKSASFYNPLIYFGLSAKFRKDVGVLLPCTSQGRDTVKLKRFKKQQQAKYLSMTMQEGGKDNRRRDQQKGEAKREKKMAAEERGMAGGPTQQQQQQQQKQKSTSPDSGVGSTPTTPPQVIEDPPVFVIDFPHSEAPDYEIDRL